MCGSDASAARSACWLGETASTLLPEGLASSLIVSGIIDGVGGVLGFTPLIMVMFFCLSFLEDSGSYNFV